MPVILKWNSRRSRRSTSGMESMSKILRGGISRLSPFPSLLLSLSYYRYIFLSQAFGISPAISSRSVEEEVQGEAEPVPQWVNVCGWYRLPRSRRPRRRCSHAENSRTAADVGPDEPRLSLRGMRKVRFSVPFLLHVRATHESRGQERESMDTYNGEEKKACYRLAI